MPFSKRIRRVNGLSKISVMKELLKHIEDRIAELNQADIAFCKDRWDMSKPDYERSLYREESNKVTFARQELQRLQKIVIELAQKNENATLTPSDK